MPHQKLVDLIAWGHDLDDYKLMFDLSDEDLNRNIIEFSCGPSAFVSEMRDKEFSAVALSREYQKPPEQLLTEVTERFAKLPAKWETPEDPKLSPSVPDVQGLFNKRQLSANKFTTHFAAPEHQKYYLPLSDEPLPFEDNSFDLALCSHLFFYRGSELDAEAIAARIEEFARVAKEVRLFPLVQDDGEVATLIGPLMMLLQAAGYGLELRSVNYELVSQGQAMLRLWRSSCDL